MKNSTESITKSSTDDLVWNLFVELRKEILESQKIRSQVMGFKIAFVSAAIGLMAKSIVSLDKALFVIPAFAAICLDFIIYSYSFSIKRIGSYTRDYIEPALKKNGSVPEDFRLWQDYLTEPKTRQNLGLYGNFGFTILTVAVGVISLFFPFRPSLSITLLIILLIFLIMDYLAYCSPKKLGKIWKDQK
jgi:hypothetical protein